MGFSRIQLLEVREEKDLRGWKWKSKCKARLKSPLVHTFKKDYVARKDKKEIRILENKIEGPVTSAPGFPGWPAKMTLRGR